MKSHILLLLGGVQCIVGVNGAIWVTGERRKVARVRNVAKALDMQGLPISKETLEKCLAETTELEPKELLKYNFQFKSVREEVEKHMQREAEEFIE